MAHTTTLTAGGRLTGPMVLTALLVFFGVVFAVNGLLIFDALSTFRGEVADHPYEIGLAFNHELAAAAAQSERHWTVDVAFVRSGEIESARVTFRDAEGNPIEGLAATGVFAAPADRKRDKPFALTESSPGLYIGEAPAPAGVWDLQLRALRGTETLFQSRNRVNLR